MNHQYPYFDFSRSLLLFFGGDAPPAFYSALGLHNAACCICADSGANHALALGLTPDLVVGDMDSIPAATLTKLKIMGVPLQTHPPKKDFTDGELALQIAMQTAKKQGLDIAVFGSTGNRPDHTLANLFIGRQAAQQGIRIRYFYDQAVGYLLQGPAELTLTQQNGSTVSLLAISENVQGVSLQGFEYPLQDFELPADHARGISNVLNDTQGHISCTRGCLYIVQNFDFQPSTNEE